MRWKKKTLSHLAPKKHSGGLFPCSQARFSANRALNSHPSRLLTSHTVVGSSSPLSSAAPSLFPSQSLFTRRGGGGGGELLWPVWGWLAVACAAARHDLRCVLQPARRAARPLPRLRRWGSARAPSATRSWRWPPTTSRRRTCWGRAGSGTCTRGCSPAAWWWPWSSSSPTTGRGSTSSMVNSQAISAMDGHVHLAGQWRAGVATWVGSTSNGAALCWAQHMSMKCQREDDRKNVRVTLPSSRCKGLHIFLSMQTNINLNWARLY